MIVNCFYDENMEFADIVYIPDCIKCNVEELQNSFFNWLFDENNDHDYWIIINGKKQACEYGIDAFVKWINDTICIAQSDKAQIIESNAKEWDSEHINLIF